MAAKKAIEKKKIDKATATGISCSVSAIITRADGTIEDLGIIAESINENEVRKNTKAIQEAITAGSTANQKLKKEKRPEYKKNNDFASIPTSGVTKELSKIHRPELIDRANKTISMKKEFAAGVILLSDKKETIDEYSSDTDIELLSQFKNNNLGFSKEEMQIYYAFFDLYLLNGKKSGYKAPFDIATKDLHYDVLGQNRNTKFRSDDFAFYKQIALKFSGRRIEYTTEKASQSYLANGKYKNICVNSSIMQMEILEGGQGEYKEQVLRIIPTTYMQHEAKVMKQISNFLPREFLNLNAHENFFYFGTYINNMHKINSSHKEVEEKTVKGKLIKKTVKVHPVSYAWEVSLKKLIEEALPEGEKTIQEYKATRRKKEYLDRKILPYITKALDVYKSKWYILKYNKKEFSSINSRTVLENDDFKISLIFNYDKDIIKSKKP